MALDLDDVLSDYVPAVLSFHNHRYQTAYTLTDVTAYGYWKFWGGTREEATRKVYEFYETDYFKKLQPVRGAVEGVKALKRNYGLVVVTSRPTDIEKQTRDWIEKFFPQTFVEIALTDAFTPDGRVEIKKSAVCRRLKAEVLVEDCLEYLQESCRELPHLRGILFDKPWNQGASLPANVKRVYSWKEIVAEIGGGAKAE